MIRLILVALFLTCFFLLGLPVLFITWVIGRFNRRVQDIACLRMVQGAFRCILFISGVKVDVIGEENVPKDQPVLYVANHRSYFDIIMTYARCPDLTGYVSKDSLDKVPFLRLWMHRLHCLFLDRKDIKKGLQMVLDGIDKIKHGISICIFPEGTRGSDPDQTKLAPFKEGSMKMAEKTGCPIIPIAISNSSQIWEDHFPKIRPTHVTIEYGAPIDPKAVPKEDRKALGALARRQIIAMLEKK